MMLPRALVWGVAITGVIALLALVSGWLVPYDPLKIAATERLQPPSARHIMGTDALGRDLFSRILAGGRASLFTALVAVGAAALPGFALGMAGGLLRGFASAALTYLMDLWMIVPGLLILLAATAAFGRSPLVLALALGAAGIPTYYGQARAETLAVRSELYITAARATGATEAHVLRHHVLPNVLPKLIVLVAFRLGGMLLVTGGLSFIGFGTKPPEPEWGALLAESRENMGSAWWLAAFPGLTIALTAFGFNLLGDGLRDWLDPRHMAY
jgi:peptide/nickel transport system permease protein